MVRHWVVTTGLPSPPGPVGFVVIGVLAGVLLARLRPPPSMRARRSVAGPLPFALTAFVAAYAAVVVVSASLWAEQVPLDERMLLPLYAAALPLAACLAARAVESGHLLRTVVLAGVAIVAVTTAAAGVELVRRGEVGYPGYTGHPWTTSPGMRELARLPAGASVYSNFPDAIYYRTGRTSRLLPRPLLPGGKPNPRYRDQLTRLAGEVADNRSTVIVFLQPGREHVSTPHQLSGTLGRPPNRALGDSVMWGGVRGPS